MRARAATQRRPRLHDALTMHSTIAVLRRPSGRMSSNRNTIQPQAAHDHERDWRLVTDDNATRRFRTLFLSDVHLGTRGCQAERLLDFLRRHDADTIYLVGDIVDGWQLRSGWYWPQAHNDVVQKLLRTERKGARTIYVPGT